MRDVAPPGPRTETVRVSSVPIANTPEIKSPQSFVPTADIAADDPAFAVRPAKKDSMLLWWILLGISAVILIIQIWTYLS
jgi:hypothetical protein